MHFTLALPLTILSLLSFTLAIPAPQRRHTQHTPTPRPRHYSLKCLPTYYQCIEHAKNRYDCCVGNLKVGKMNDMCVENLHDNKAACEEAYSVTGGSEDAAACERVFAQHPFQSSHAEKNCVAPTENQLVFGGGFKL